MTKNDWEFSLSFPREALNEECFSWDMTAGSGTFKESRYVVRMLYLSESFVLRMSWNVIL